MDKNAVKNDGIAWKYAVLLSCLSLGFMRIDDEIGQIWMQNTWFGIRWLCCFIFCMSDDELTDWNENKDQQFLRHVFSNICTISTRSYSDRTVLSLSLQISRVSSSYWIICLSLQSDVIMLARDLFICVCTHDDWLLLIQRICLIYFNYDSSVSSFFLQNSWFQWEWFLLSAVDSWQKALKWNTWTFIALNGFEWEERVYLLRVPTVCFCSFMKWGKFRELTPTAVRNYITEIWSFSEEIAILCWDVVVKVFEWLVWFQMSTSEIFWSVLVLFTMFFSLQWDGIHCFAPMNEIFRFLPNDEIERCRMMHSMQWR